MIRLAALLLALAGPGWATQDQWPALFDVHGVAEDDVLNIRAEPTASAPIVGTFQPDQKGIEVIHVDNTSGTWGYVNLLGEGGWVSLSYLQRKPGQWFGASPDIKSCYGTEPFWSLKVTNSGAVVWSTPENIDTSGHVTGRFPSSNTRLSHGISVAFDTTQLLGLIRLARCSDGMSDKVYGVSVDLFADGDDMLYSGCCTLED